MGYELDLEEQRLEINKLTKERDAWKKYAEKLENHFKQRATLNSWDATYMIDRVKKECGVGNEV